MNEIVFEIEADDRPVLEAWQRAHNALVLEQARLYALSAGACMSLAIGEKLEPLNPEPGLKMMHHVERLAFHDTTVHRFVTLERRGQLDFESFACGLICQLAAEKADLLKRELAARQAERSLDRKNRSLERQNKPQIPVGAMTRRTRFEDYAEAVCDDIAFGLGLPPGAVAPPPKLAPADREARIFLRRESRSFLIRWEDTDVGRCVLPEADLHLLEDAVHEFMLFNRIDREDFGYRIETVGHDEWLVTFPANNRPGAPCTCSCLPESMTIDFSDCDRSVEAPAPLDPRLEFPSVPVSALMTRREAGARSTGETCPECGGSGEYVGLFEKGRCTKCGGSGSV